MQKIPCVDFKITNWSDNWFNLWWLEYITDANWCCGPELSSVPSKSPAAQILCSRKLLTARVQEDSCCQHLLSSCFSNWAVCYQWPSVFKNTNTCPLLRVGKKIKKIKNREKKGNQEKVDRRPCTSWWESLIYLYFSIIKFLTTATGLNLYSGRVRLARYP